MKINPNFKLREIAGETIVVNQGTPDVDMTRIISLNASARLLWEQLYGKDFEADDAATLLADTYGIPAGQAKEDAQAWIKALETCKILAM